MSIRGVFIASTGIFLIGLCGCSNPSGGEVGCLGGGSVCQPSTTLTTNNTNSTVTTNQSSGGFGSSGVFGCTANATPNPAYPGEEVQVTISITGTPSGNVEITDFNNQVIPAGTTTTAVYGAFSPNDQGQTLTPTVDLQDSAGNTANCSFSIYIE
jgi:hypothetical protein